MKLLTALKPSKEEVPKAPFGRLTVIMTAPKFLEFQFMLGVK